MSDIYACATVARTLEEAALRTLLMAPVALLFATTAWAAPPPPTPGDISMFEENGAYVLRTNDAKPIYTFDRDQPGKSNCNGPCATAWPPVVASPGSRPVGGWTMIKRDDGASQWAYRGKPVYSFAHDDEGKANGDGMGGVWHLLPPTPK